MPCFLFSALKKHASLKAHRCSAVTRILTPIAVNTPNPELYPETHNIGTGTLEQRIGPQACPPLWKHGINLTGTSDAKHDFKFIRWNPQFSQLLVTFEGEGRVWVNGQWKSLPPGFAYVTPPGQFHAYHTSPGYERWLIGWIVVPKPSPSPLPFLLSEPSVIQTDGALIRATITGLAHESFSRADAGMLNLWAQLIRGLMTRVMGNVPHDEIVDVLWRRISTQLAHPWSLVEMANTLGCSEEHLRRLCQKQYGCSPMRRLAGLRMQHAASLLTETHLTVSAIGQLVGYESEFAFSNAFKRWSDGAPPSIYRRKALMNTKIKA